MNEERNIITRIAWIILPLTLTIIAVIPGEQLLADDCPDAWITAKVKTRLLADDGVKAFKINVDTEECVVSLNGCAETRSQRGKAVKIARAVKKVRAVQNNLKICPKEKDG